MVRHGNLKISLEMVCKVTVITTKVVDDFSLGYIETAIILIDTERNA